MSQLPEKPPDYSGPPPAYQPPYPPAGQADQYDPKQPPPSYQSTNPPYPTSPPAGQGIPGAAPQPPYPQQYGAATTSNTVILVEGDPQMRGGPVSVVCPSCHAYVTSSVTHTPGLLAWLMSGLLCLFGLWICACIPCCVDDCQDAQHHCPNCGAYLGSFTRL